MPRADRAASFRWRFFAVAALCVGTALCLVLLMGWHSLMARELARLDDRLCMEGRRLVSLADGRENARPDDRVWPRLAQDLALKLHVDDASDLRARVTDARGVVALESPKPWPLGGSAVWQGQVRAAPDDPQSELRGQCRWAVVSAWGREWRAVEVRHRRGKAMLALDSATLGADLRADLSDVLLVTLPVGVVLALLGAALLSFMIMRPLRRLSTAMRRMDHLALDERLSDAGEDKEFRELIAAYNTMLARLDASFHQASRFSADAAHELRTPLTILRGRLEQAIQRTEGRAVQEELGLIQDEVGRLVAITRKLLLLSQADAGRLPLSSDQVDLGELLRELIADAGMLADPQSIAADIAPGLRLAGDQGLLRQLFNNLMSNALRYRTEGGWIRIQAHRRDDGIEVVIANPCAPLDAVSRGRFFERFFRADPAHGRRADGTGLGMSLVREIARAHGGEAALLDSRDDEVHVRVWLPA